MNIKLDLKIFIFIAIFILTQNINIYAILMFFGLIHELGHLLCGLLLRLQATKNYNNALWIKTRFQSKLQRLQ